MNRTDRIWPARLLPLIPDSPNEGVANSLARLLIEDEIQSREGAQGALLILTGLQAFLDTGTYLAVEQLWEPVIVCRQMQKAYRESAWKKAAEMAAACKTVNDERGAFIYERVATLLDPKANKEKS